MIVDGICEVFNTIYIAKKLFDMGRYDLVKDSFSDTIDLDLYYDNMYSLMGNLHEYYYCRYFENHNIELHVLSGPEIVDFYKLAGKYGRRNNIPEADNPYIKEAGQEVRNNLDISHCLDWKLVGHTEPGRPFHSRLALFISQDCGCLDLGVLVYRLIVLHGWFTDKCGELRSILDDTMGGIQISLPEEVMAA